MLTLQSETTVGVNCYHNNEIYVFRELRAKFKPFARLVDVEQYEKFISSKKKELQLKQQIKELKQYRKNGISKLEGQCEDVVVLGMFYSVD